MLLPTKAAALAAALIASTAAALETLTVGGAYGFTGDVPGIYNGDVRPFFGKQTRVRTLLMSACTGFAILQGKLVLQQVWQFTLGSNPTSLKFSPVSPHVITVHKYGELRIYASIDAPADQFARALDINAAVFDFADEGFLGFALDPGYDSVNNKFGETLCCYAKAVWASNALLGSTLRRYSCQSSLVMRCYMRSTVYPTLERPESLVSFDLITAYIYYSSEPGAAFAATNQKKTWPNTAPANAVMKKRE